MASAGRPRVLVRIHQPGRARLGGRYTLIVTEHPRLISDSPIGSGREWGAIVEHITISTRRYSTKLRCRSMNQECRSTDRECHLTNQRVLKYYMCLPT